MKRFTRIAVGSFMMAALGLASPAAMAADDGAGAQQLEVYTPGDTAADPLVDEAVLALMLPPLTKAELEAEAEAWMAHVRAKAMEIARREIDVKTGKRALDKAKETAAAAKEAAKELQEAQEAVAKAAETGDEEARRKAEKAAGDAQEAVEELEKVESEPVEGAEGAQAGAPDAAAPDAAAPDRDQVLASDAALQESRESAEGKKQMAEQQAEEVAEKRATTLATLAELRTQQTALIDRASRVLDALEKKGGDVSEHRTYLAAISGIRVDVSDTSAAWATIQGWLTSSEGGVRWAKNLGKFIAIVVAFWILSMIVGRLVDRALGASRRMTTLLRAFIGKSVRRITLAVGIVVAVSALEVNIGPLLAVIGAAGFVIAFALQDSLANFASGIMILLYRPFDVGDVVDIADVSGKVGSLNLVSTTINTFDNKVVIVPNNSVWGNVITNATGSRRRRVDMMFGIGYDADMNEARGILERILSEHELVLEDPAPVVRVHELADSSVNLVCRPWVRTEDYWTVFWDVTQRVKEEFDAAGISIPFPQRDVHVHQVGGASPDVSMAGAAGRTP